MKKGWEIKKIVDTFFIRPPKKEVREKLSDTDMVSFLPMEDLGVLSKDIFLTKERQLKSVEGSYTYFANNDVLLAKITPCFENGKLGIAQGLKNGIGFGSSEYIVFREKGEIISDYLFYFLSQQKIRNEGKKLMTGAVGHKRVSKDFIENYLIPFPKEIDEQKRIVAILDKVFGDIGKAKENAKQNLKNAKELFESYLQSIFINKGDNWEEKTLGDVLLKTETVDPTKKPNEEFIYLDVSSVNKETKEIESAVTLLGKDAPSRAKKMVRTNDVIFATVRPTHSRVALITREYDGQVCSTGYFVLRTKDFLNNKLVFYFLLTKDFNKQMEKLQKGASYPAVTDTEVKSIYITYPKSLKEQQDIVIKLDNLSTETKKLETVYQNKIRDLEELKKSILQKAFNGDL